MTPKFRHFLAIVVLFMSAKLAFATSTGLGVFSHQRDIGDVARPGSVSFDPARGEYLIAGGGGNMWYTNDAFHFAWKKMSGDFTLTADVKFIGTGGNLHRKACLLVRQSLEPGSVYADIALHGIGLTSLQYRDVLDGTTHEIQSNISAPTRMRIEKRGDYISMWLAPAGENLKPAGGYLKIPFKGKFYVGLGVCAHDNNTVEKAVFSNVELKPVSTPANAQPVLESTLEIVGLALMDRRVVYRTRDHIEAPNWSRDGKFFLINATSAMSPNPDR
jgi:TolB protein